MSNVLKFEITVDCSNYIMKYWYDHTMFLYDGYIIPNSNKSLRLGIQGNTFKDLKLDADCACFQFDNYYC